MFDSSASFKTHSSGPREIDLQEALTQAVGAAEKAGERILQGYEEELHVEQKTDLADRVTNVDTESQRIIVGHLHAAFPAQGFLCEEEGEEGSSEGEARIRWIIDPLDGTMNFTYRLPFVGVSIALELDGKIVLGVLHLPALQETLTAVRGKGAKKNGNSISVRSCEKLEDALLAEIFSDRESRGRKVQYPSCMAYRKFGSAVTPLAFLADGRVDGVVLRCRKWDIAAAEIIVSEAGGKVTIEQDEVGNERGVLTVVASVPGIHSALCAEFV